MRPPHVLATVTLATIAGIAGLAGLAVGVGAVATHPSHDRAGATPVAAPAPPPAPAMSQTSVAPARPAHPDPALTAPAASLAPRPPADGRDAPDPFVLEDSDRWVLYSTQVGHLNVPVATAPDLAIWSPPTDALPKLPAWAASGRTWAPGVLARPGGFVLYFAAHSRATGGQCVGAATSTSATGPFTSSAAEPLVCQPELGGSIDPYPFVDADGTPYLLWKADGNAVGGASILFAQRLGPSGLTLESDAVPLLQNDASWETPLIENPALVRLDGRYTLLYSGGWWESDSYATGYATCDTPLGPCVKATTEQTLHASDRSVAGPGGATVITGPAGDVWLAHHGWAPGVIGYAAGGVRSLRFTSLRWDGAQLTVHRPT
jgi:beta-xylosidase